DCPKLRPSRRFLCIRGRLWQSRKTDRYFRLAVLHFSVCWVRCSSKCNEANDSRKTFSMGTKIYVGNLPWRATDAQLSQLFGSHGEVTDAKIVTDRETGRSRGFGFVTMISDDAAQAAIRALNGYSLEGRSLVVNEAREQGGGRRPGGYG